MRSHLGMAARLASVGVLSAACLAACGPRVEPADMVLNNGKIVTVDTARPDAQALAVRSDIIVAVGSNEEIAPYIGQNTRVIDLAGQLAIPGFIDAHLHFSGIGEAKMNLDLTKVSGWDEIVAMVGEAAGKAQPGEWILGRGWHQEKWNTVPTPNVEGFPIHTALSKVSPNNPVLLTHASGHATIANEKAMQLAGVTKKTPNPPGGEILKDTAGNPIGVFRETASGLIRKALAEALAKRTPEEVEANDRKEMELAAQDCLSKGVTSVHDAGVSFATIDLYKKLAGEGSLGVRMYAMVNEGNDSLVQRLTQYKITGFGNNHLTVRAIKRVLDGALGSRGAWFLEPYTDLPTSTGLNTIPVDQLADTARLAIEQGFQLNVHTIGDRANREALNVFETAFKSHPDQKDVRWRLEHAQHLSLADIPRFGQLGVIASMQGIHCTSDGPFVLARLGPQRAEEGAYVWQKLMKSGAIVANGTDAPVEDVDPIPGYYALVTRRMKNGQTFFPDQRMSRQEALKAYTLSGAYAAFEEGIKGSLTAGKLADITVLSRDITTVPEEEIPSAEVRYTIVGGKVMYKR
jgi:predicted amidohydrolase YtcJ